MSEPLFRSRQPYVWAKSMVNIRITSSVSYKVWRQTKDRIMSDDKFTSLDVRNVLYWKIRK